ncbi:helix-turn-helix domain-containing protein [Tenacibaculum ovolyticum]|jgi:transcriptional regulator with XRE-family HTH domain|uniref:helix-turn-helix domain-containing protein n=1 Tax=Tenacibaculum ovolyticum TaxID=104270 RepID=UPI0003FA758E|nr:helix-turn-helix transcriptional regulator [Tenacibaculum ovolyticum]
MSFFGKNIKKIRGVKGLSQQAFAEVFDLKRATLGAYEEGRSEPKIDTIIKIANYFSISIGSMLTSELTVNELLRFKGDLTVADEVVKKEEFTAVPCVTEKNIKEYIQFYDKKNFVNDMPVLQLPINKDKVFRGYTVSSLEMTNHDKGLYPKDIVVGEFVPKEVIKKLNNGIVVLVLVEDALILRRLYVTKKEVVLRADHKNIEDKKYELKDVKELWRIRYVFFKRLPEFNDLLEEKMLFLEQEFTKLKNRL